MLVRFDKPDPDDTEDWLDAIPLWLLWAVVLIGTASITIMIILGIGGK